MTETLIQDSKKIILDEVSKNGYETMGTTASYTWRNDPRHVLFTMARYKFCAKMLEGKKKVLEVGCGDGFCLPIMLQTVGTVHGIDLEPSLVEENKRTHAKEERTSFEAIDLTKDYPKGPFDAAYSLDVIEHIPPEIEDVFMSNIARSLTDDGVLIMGTPNVTASAYASEVSQIGHINLKSGEELRSLLGKHFNNTFLFSMNDEMVHTGYTPMAHYVIVMGVGVKR